MPTLKALCHTVYSDRVPTAGGANRGHGGRWIKHISPTKLSAVSPLKSLSRGRCFETMQMPQFPLGFLALPGSTEGSCCHLLLCCRPNIMYFLPSFFIC